MTKTKNLTPAHLRCSIGGCPSIHQLKDGRLLIVGKDVILDPKLLGLTIPPPEGLDVGVGERAIVISPDLLSDYVAQASAGILAENARLKEMCGSARFALYPFTLEDEWGGEIPDLAKIMIGIRIEGQFDEFFPDRAGADITNVRRAMSAIAAQGV